MPLALVGNRNGLHQLPITECILPVGTCELEIFIRIQSAATIRIESGCSRLRVPVIIIITDEQRCVDSPGSSNNIARSLLQC